MAMELSLTLGLSDDTADGVVRLDVSDRQALGVQAGDVVVLEGARRTFARVQPAFMEDRNQRLARASALTAGNTGFREGHVLRLGAQTEKLPLAERVVLEAADEMDRLHLLARIAQLAAFWRGRVAIEGDEIALPTLGRFPLVLKVAGVQPAGAVVIGNATLFSVATRRNEGDWRRLGGLREAYKTSREIAQDRLKRRSEGALGAVLLQGTEGSGKALLVRRLAQETGAALQVVDARGLMDRVLARGGLEEALSLSDLARRGPTILLLDHLEALAQAPDALAVTARLVAASIAALLDEVPTQPQILAFGVSAEALPSALAGLFDSTIRFDPPNRWERHEILLALAAGRSLREDLDLADVAAMASGATARDLARLVVAARHAARGEKIGLEPFIEALRLTPFSAADVVRCEVPRVAWDEVAGLDDVKQMFVSTLQWSLRLWNRFSAAGVNVPRSILLSGGQGTGKTSLVRSLASFMPVHLVEVDCALLRTRSETDGAAFLHEAFALARRKGPCVLFLDDVDALFDEEGGQGLEPSHRPLVSFLMAELDHLHLLPGVSVIAATNRPDRLSAESLQAGRFDFAVTLPLPDAAARKKILQIHARKLPLASDIDFDRLAAAMQGMSGAEIAALCNRVGMMALRSALSGPEGGLLPAVVSADLFEQALRGKKN